MYSEILAARLQRDCNKKYTKNHIYLKALSKPFSQYYFVWDVISTEV